MMAVLNNWDLKDVNNSVYSDSKTGEQVFLVSDVGATFGSNGLAFSKAHAKGNVDSFKGSKFITSTTATTVSFGTPSAPTTVLLASFGTSAKSYAMRKDLEWIGNDVPIADARWMGGMLQQLSHKQLEDAFRAGTLSGRRDPGVRDRGGKPHPGVEAAYAKAEVNLCQQGGFGFAAVELDVVELVVDAVVAVQKFVV